MGAPIGNKNARRAGRWKDALNRALAQYESKDVNRGEALRKIAENVVQAAIGGDKDAIKEIGERLDGKATQVIDANVNVFDRLSEADQLAFLAALDALDGSEADAEAGVEATH